MIRHPLLPPASEPAVKGDAAGTWRQSLDNMTNLSDGDARQSVELKNSAVPYFLHTQGVASKSDRIAAAKGQPQKRRPKRKKQPRSETVNTTASLMPVPSSQFAAFFEIQFNAADLELEPGAPVFDVTEHEQRLGAVQPQKFWSAEQRRVLDAQALPPDQYYTAASEFNGATPHGPVRAPEIPPFERMVKSVPLPYADTRLHMYCEAYSQVEAEFNGYRGVQSSDPLLLEDTDELLRFLQTYNTRPLLFVEVHGFHAELSSSSALNQPAADPVSRQVTDFDFKIDISQYIYPFGYIQSTAADVALLDTVVAFRTQRSCSKRMRMQKIIYFEFEKLRRKVYKYMRGELGWCRGLAVGFPRMNHSVAIRQDGCSSGLSEASWSQCFSSLIQLCSTSSSEDHSELQSVWKVEYTADQTGGTCDDICARFFTNMSRRSFGSPRHVQ